MSHVSRPGPSTGGPSPVDAIYTVLTMIHKSSDVFPPLKSATGIAIHIVDTTRNFQANKKDWQEFADHIAKSIVDINKLAGNLVADRQDIRETLENFVIALESIQDQIKAIQPKQGKSRFKLFAGFIDEKGLVPPLRKQFDEALKELYHPFMVTTGIDVANLMDTLERDRQKSQKTELHRNLASLPSAENSAWDAAQGCLPETRTQLISEVMQLMQRPDSSSPRICLLTGVAGSGKSTVAHSIAKTCFEKEMLASSFFFKAAQKDRDTPKCLITTFARGLASTDPGLAEEISSTLLVNSAITASSITVQFDKLILAPLKNHPPSRTTVFVLDALDEGYTDELLTLLSKRVTELHSNIRFFITSRPSTDAVQDLLVSKHVHRLILDTHDTANEADLLVYVKYRLQAIAAVKDDLPPRWPGDKLTNEFAHRAGGLFQWARTTLDYIKLSVYPDKKLTDLMSNAVGVWAGPEEQMDGTYRTILQGYLWSDNDFVEGYHAVVGAVIASKTPLSISALQSLHSAMPSLRVKTVVKMLGALLHDVGDLKKPLEPLHLSLREFLTSNTRVQNAKFYIDPASHNSRLALHCLQLLNQELPVHEIPDLGYLTEEGVPDGMPVIPRHSVSEAVWYACRFWADHMKDIQSASLISPDYVPVLREFLTKHLVMWLEIVTGVERYQELLVVKKWLLDNEAHISDTKLLDKVFSKHLATCLKNVSRRLSDASRHDEALLAAIEAVDLYRHLVANLDIHQRPVQQNLVRLANGLRRQSQCYSAVGNPLDALHAIDECSKIWRTLEADGFDVSTHYFAQALKNLANCYADLGRMNDALRVIEEAVEVAARAKPDDITECDTHAACLHSYTNHLSTVGRREEALVAICKAVDIRREIVKKSDNVNCLEELVTSLESQAIQVGGDLNAAVEVSTEALHIHRVLSQGRPSSYTYLADLARGLNNFSNHLDRRGDAKKDGVESDAKRALEAIEEVVSLGRRLVEENPIPFDPDLSICLSNYSNCLTNQDRHQEALDIMLEATEIHRKLANRFPEIYEDNLATALRTLGRCYAAVGGQQDKVAACVNESSEVMERVAARNPAGVSPGLVVDDDKIDIVQSTRHPRNRKKALPIVIME